MSLNDSLFGEESIRWKGYEKLLKTWEDKKRATQNKTLYNKNITNQPRKK